MASTFGRRGVAAAAVVAASMTQLTGSDSRLFGAPPPKSIALTPIGVYRTGHFDLGGSEIAAYDPESKRVFTVNLEDQRVDVLDISDPTSPVLVLAISITAWGSQRTIPILHHPTTRPHLERSRSVTFRRVTTTRGTRSR